MKINTQPTSNYYVIDENNFITNVIVATEDVALEMNLKPVYEGAWIGDTYNPPIEPEEITPDEDTIKYIGDSIQDGIDSI